VESTISLAWLQRASTVRNAASRQLAGGAKPELSSIEALKSIMSNAMGTMQVQTTSR